MSEPVSVVGGGLAGCEAAWFLANRGHVVRLYEMRPVRRTPAHQTDLLAELVCTNSFKSEDPATAHGQLKREMACLGSLLLRCAAEARVPAGSALAVDREMFAGAMTTSVGAHPRIEIVRDEIVDIPAGPAVIATGPLTSAGLSGAVRGVLGDAGLAFYDAIAPILGYDSINLGIAFPAGRFGEDDDYLNCPLSRAEYGDFIRELRAAATYEGHEWENLPYFEGCLPIEVMASRGEQTLRFGPMKPIGLEDPRTGRRPFAVVQLRREDRGGQMWNMVGFQTRLRHAEQKRVFQMIPGLDHAEFLRFGSIHRNSYLNFPACLTPPGALPSRPDILFAGQLTGVEGYTESAASGIMAALNLDRVLRGLQPAIPPTTTMLGGLYRYLRETKAKHFQPMNSNWGLVDPLSQPEQNRDAKRRALAERALADFRRWLREGQVAAETGETGEAGTAARGHSGKACPGESRDRNPAVIPAEAGIQL
ncbi:MAG: methylenetetrahydrofolate--tRNA-(uracil(54)-C(5))-methyltransferase (FADH(2)-oxidizing) TrmFO [Gemmatimonadetes bacterium]|nr:methylenetetrahydrofolate--tRNA-(uracil(54)-C(5))-methyltransferase (FADH(2)-oxidizing) TrmFO [Gemmatimonadota bacterium]